MHPAWQKRHPAWQKRHPAWQKRHPAWQKRCTAWQKRHPNWQNQGGGVPAPVSSLPAGPGRGKPAAARCQQRAQRQSGRMHTRPRAHKHASARALGRASRTSASLYARARAAACPPASRKRESGPGCEGVPLLQWIMHSPQLSWALQWLQWVLHSPQLYHSFSECCIECSECCTLVSIVVNSATVLTKAAVKL